MNVTKRERAWMPPRDNPFLHDAFNMGVKLGENVTIMMGNHENDVCTYLYIVDTFSGSRIKVEFGDEFSNILPEVKG